MMPILTSGPRCRTTERFNGGVCLVFYRQLLTLRHRGGGHKYEAIGQVTIGVSGGRAYPIVCSASVRHLDELGTHLTSLAVSTVVKPFNIDQLVAAVATAFAGGAAVGPEQRYAQPDSEPV